MEIAQIFKNNADWVKSKLDLDANYFSELSKGQSPDFLYIGCSDSRVTAEKLMGLEPGEVFVHRNIANLVPTTDLNSLSVIDYAVTHLKVKHVVVCGHYYCGGVKAAMGSGDLGVINPWVANIRDVYRLHQTELDGITDEDARYRRLVELNVQEQCINAIKTAPLQKALANNNIEVHGWVFDIGTGEIIDLNIDFESLMKDTKSIYKLD